MPITQVITIGADPEVFLEEQGKIVSAIGRIGGSKEKPLLVPFGALQEDNVLAEFNIEPVIDVQSFIRNIYEVQKELQNRVFPAKLIYKPSHEFDADYLYSCGPMALAFGCVADYDCWTGERNPIPSSPNKGLRSGGGHIHVGCTDYPAQKIAQAMDLYVGTASIQLDKDKTRRELYGKSGAFRRKDYGAEYRVLSNFWLTSEQLITWVYNTTMMAINRIDSMREDMIKIGGLSTIRQCINNSDEELSRKITKQLKVDMP